MDPHLLPLLERSKPYCEATYITSRKARSQKSQPVQIQRENRAGFCKISKLSS